jgi:hypothetical protein
VSGNDFHIWWNHSQDGLESLDHAADRASAGNVDKGEAIGHKVIPHVDDFGLGEEDDAVSVGMAMGQVNGANLFAIEMDRGPFIERDDGQCFLGGRLNIRAYDGTAFLEALTNIAVGDNGGVVTELRVASRMVEMEMGVENESDGFISDLLQTRIFGARGAN